MIAVMVLAGIQKLIDPKPIMPSVYLTNQQNGIEGKDLNGYIGFEIFLNVIIFWCLFVKCLFFLRVN